MTDTLIKVENVSKKFCRSLKRSLWYGMQDLGSELIGRRHNRNSELRENEFWAVRDVSFEVKRGECLGLIGGNGAGKSTLLKMLNGLIKPDQGRIKMYGRVGALIELGAGFNPTLTGRENVYINGSVLGFTKNEISRKFEAIIDFAEIGSFIDAPVQTYSSGMKVRLGFAVASQMEPDILLVDEVLTVGDLAFRIKCLNRIAEIRRFGTSVIFVSHEENQVRAAAQRCVLLDHGSAKSYESVNDAFFAYGQLLDASTQTEYYVGFVHDGPVKLKFLGCTGDGGKYPPAVLGNMVLAIQCITETRIIDANLELLFWTSSGQLVSTIRSSLANQSYDLPEGVSQFYVKVSNIALAPGKYRIAGAVRKDGGVLGWARDLACIDLQPPAVCVPSCGIVMQDAAIFAEDHMDIDNKYRV